MKCLICNESAYVSYEDSRVAYVKYDGRQYPDINAPMKRKQSRFIDVSEGWQPPTTLRNASYRIVVEKQKFIYCGCGRRLP